jgi:hypothetical protein
MKENEEDTKKKGEYGIKIDQLGDKIVFNNRILLSLNERICEL